MEGRRDAIDEYEGTVRPCCVLNANSLPRENPCQTTPPGLSLPGLSHLGVVPCWFAQEADYTHPYDTHGKARPANSVAV